MILILFLALFTHNNLFARNPLPSSRFEQLSGVTKSKDIKHNWDKKFNMNTYVFGKSPAQFLSENVNYITSKSTVLDMGMGEGRNAVYLAEQGHLVTGIDISSVASKKALMLAKERNVNIKTIVADLKTYDFKADSFDVILCFYYVDRSLNNKIYKWLKPGGLLIYESYTNSQLKVKGHEKTDPSYLLKPQELLTLFPKMRVLKYEEPLLEKDFRASVILKK